MLCPCVLTIVYWSLSTVILSNGTFRGILIVPIIMAPSYIKRTFLGLRAHFCLGIYSDCQINLKMPCTIMNTELWTTNWIYRWIRRLLSRPGTETAKCDLCDLLLWLLIMWFIWLCDSILIWFIWLKYWNCTFLCFTES